MKNVKFITTGYYFQKIKYGLLYLKITEEFITV